MVNVEQAAAWAGEGETWARYDDRYNASIRPQTRRLLAAAAITPGQVVLDVGCGCGDSTRQAAQRAAPDGRALGVDLSAPMLARARQRARDAGLDNVAFVQADAQVHPFDRGRFDVAISRFGATFFADAVAGFANIRAGLRPGGRLAVLAWQALDRNAWLVTIREALAPGRTLAPPPSDQPGMFAFADPGRVTTVLASAGFGAVDLAAVDDPVRLGDDGDHAFAFLSETGFARAMLHGLDAASAAASRERLRAALGAADAGAGVLLGAAAWLVTAVAPA